jgi:hypothetical protein
VAESQQGHACHLWQSCQCQGQISCPLCPEDVTPDGLDRLSAGASKEGERGLIELIGGDDWGSGGGVRNTVSNLSENLICVLCILNYCGLLSQRL